MGEVPLSPEERQEVGGLLNKLCERIFLHPSPRLSQRHKSLIDMITTYSGDPSTTSVLELGCSHGDFVDYLIEQGYNVEGVDINEEVIKRSNKPYLHHGDIAYLDDVIGGKKFNLIVAASVLDIPTQIYHLFGDEPTPDGNRVVRLSPEHTTAALKNIEQILESVFKHLTPGGFLMACNRFTEYDQIGFTREIAEKIGYVVKQLDRQEAILQKPLSK